MSGRSRGHNPYLMATSIESLELLDNQDANLSPLERVFGHPLTGIPLQPYLIRQSAPMLEMALSACFHNNMYGNQGAHYS